MRALCEMPTLLLYLRQHAYGLQSTKKTASRRTPREALKPFRSLPLHAFRSLPLHAHRATTAHHTNALPGATRSASFSAF